ncbi:MAG TPA: exodeoxyribonuclease VII large subunit [Phycisphaerales bacterium]|nr:exodeoxyribonuclease VII large subunit [Phycisphaerales bacterium]
MVRPKFDPAKAEGGDAPLLRPASKPMTVTEASELIKSTLEYSMPSSIRVVGQVSNFNVRNHWYFSLKDSECVLNCVAWAAHARKIGLQPRDGDEVVAAGHVTHYGPQGRTQMYVTELAPVGAGALHLRFQALCSELRALGYFAEERKKALPVFPRRIAVITSRSGAALHDVVATAGQRCKAVGLVVIDVRVQGAEAADEVARAITWVNAESDRLKVDAILVTRGGGSAEDLWTFNERVVADAAYASKLPLVAAIGHESDVTVIELVADARAATPTQAAVRLVPSSKDLHTQITHTEHRLEILTRKLLQARRAQLEAITRHEAFRDPTGVIRVIRERMERCAVELQRSAILKLAKCRGQLDSLIARWRAAAPHAQFSRLSNHVDQLQRRLREASVRGIHLRRTLLAAQEQRLAAVDPLAVLERGFSCTTTASGRLIRSVEDVRATDVVRTIVSDGSFRSHVLDGKLDGSHAQHKGTKQSRERQMDLFHGIQ